MKKRVVALLSTVLLVAGMSMSAMAAPSVEGSDVITGIESVYDANDEDITAKIVVEDIPTSGYEYADEVDYIQDKDNMIAELGDAYESGMQIIDIKNVRVVGDPDEINWDATITFTVTPNRISEGQKVVLLHFDPEQDAWEVIDAEAGDDVITAVFDSLSPVAFIAKETKAPSTGDPMMVTWAIAAVVTGAAGIVASKKRA